MQLKILLFTGLLMFEMLCEDVTATADSNRGDNRLGDIKHQTKENRIPFEVPKAAIDTDVPAVLMQSKGVRTFDQDLATFTSLYPMECGMGVKVHWEINGAARCKPDTNDIIIVQESDSLYTEYCMRVMLCNSSSIETQMCDPRSIKIWLPDAHKLLDHTSVKDYTEAQLAVEPGQLIFNVDPGCDMWLEKSHKMRHRFQNKPDGIRSLMKKYPGFYLQPSIRHKRRLYKGDLSLGFPAIYKGVRTYASEDCHAECDEGQLFYYEYTANAQFYGKIFVDGYKCDWFKVCLRGGPGVKDKKYYCKSADMIHVYVRNGFVIMPRAMNGATIRLVKSTGKNRDHKEQPTQIGLDYDGETFSIWSVGRERVASTKMMAHDGHILFYFSHHDCLIKKLGIRHFGLLNGKVYQIYEDKPVHNVSKGEGEAITYDTVKPRDTLGTLATEKPTPNASLAAAPTTTRERNIEHILSQTGRKIKRARTGWLIWALFYGFFVGSFVSILLFGTLLYFARRSVYSDWYRGMYKRYGCDASGVTGGVTGSQFGTTTTGAVSGFTTAGTTTGGTTTGGTTTGTTTGATTSGGTSTGESTTGGTSGTGGTTGDSTGATSGTSTGGDMVTM